VRSGGARTGEAGSVEKLDRYCPPSVRCAKALWAHREATPRAGYPRLLADGAEILWVESSRLTRSSNETHVR